MSYQSPDTRYQNTKHKNHKDLIVYQRAYQVSLDIYKRSSAFPKEEKYAITDQLRRASSSVCANIAEGYGRQLTSNIDFKRFLVIAKGSCQEVQVWVDFAFDLGFINQTIQEQWISSYVEISKMIYALIKTLEEKS